MTADSREEILHRIRKGLGKGEGGESKDAYPPEPANSPADDGLSKDSLADTFAESLSGINTSVYRANRDGVLEFVTGFIKERGVKSFSIWETAYLESLGIARSLEGGGLDIAPAEDKAGIAGTGIGITEADYAIADTGSLVLLSSPERPRGVSLIPPVHLAIVRKENILSDIGELFGLLDEIYESPEAVPACTTFITGPSRTADIELNLTLGVHGPKELHVLIVS
ncbi:MAG TPA: lactate utilization protein C [Thermodesulfobacteriota bacterium]|nr:lactate utilization protein C [Thermodesulfobacteriota bacterium]